MRNNNVSKMHSNTDLVYFIYILYLYLNYNYILFIFCIYLNTYNFMSVGNYREIS